MVEHSLGKGEVESSILSCSTIFHNNKNILDTFRIAFGLDRSINGGSFTAASEKKLVAYFNKAPKDPGNGQPLVPMPVDALAPGSFLNDTFKSNHANGTVTGDADLDALINKRLRRDPATRPSFADILKEPVFRRPGVCSLETRIVIAALGSMNPKSSDEIKALAAKMKV